MKTSWSSIDGPADGFYDPGQEDVTTMPLEPRKDGMIRLRVLVDRPSVEISGNCGQRVMPNQIFGSGESLDSIDFQLYIR